MSALQFWGSDRQLRSYWWAFATDDHDTVVVCICQADVDGERSTQQNDDSQSIVHWRDSFQKYGQNLEAARVEACGLKW